RRMSLVRSVPVVAGHLDVRQGRPAAGGRAGPDGGEQRHDRGHAGHGQVRNPVGGQQRRGVGDDEGGERLGERLDGPLERGHPEGSGEHGCSYGTRAYRMVFACVSDTTSGPPSRITPSGLIAVAASRVDGGTTATVR